MDCLRCSVGEKKEGWVGGTQPKIIVNDSLFISLATGFACLFKLALHSCLTSLSGGAASRGSVVVAFGCLFHFLVLFIGAPPPPSLIPSPFSFFYSTLLIYYYLPIKKGVVLDFVHIYINLQKNRNLPTEEGSKISGAGNFIKINFGLKFFLGLLF